MSFARSLGSPAKRSFESRSANRIDLVLDLELTEDEKKLVVPDGDLVVVRLGEDGENNNNNVKKDEEDASENAASCTPFGFYSNLCYCLPMLCSLTTFLVGTSKK